MRVLIAAGGTGGHVFPAVAVAEKLIEQGCELNWVGRPQSLEEHESWRLGIPFVSMPLRGFKRKWSLSNLSALTMFFQGRRLVKETLEAFCPHILFALGSYVSAPAISAAIAMKFPVIVHEQNAIPGLVVRFFAKKVNVVALTQPLQSTLSGNCEVVGLPLRPGICLSREEAHYLEFGLNPSKKTLFVFGGSQGALQICYATLDLARFWEQQRPEWQILLQTGRHNFEEIGRASDTANLVAVPHLDEIGKAYACADVIVARSGATSCAEIAAVGKPAVLVPYPYATANHQELNARAHLEKHPGELIPETMLNRTQLDGAIQRLAEVDPRPMCPEERERPVANLLELIAKHAKGGGKNGGVVESPR
ncbi:MAG: UDP-N-acetylglucosamine--N-acetylmuramyl-(pentapeptide) pyrophosphoryl-undecaprenol N-acetylglucosamine transferase [Candidatus Omnitrophica bacterium]|nr:UDP-N-acetylglucosamine--N-acetylmuramyl-(pentapeptide) pyrophosphoryl-undecaprenol N-acetylglucosamine transferase [Candidatus Omnitrophota bacterium]